MEEVKFLVHPQNSFIYERDRSGGGDCYDLMIVKIDGGVLFIPLILHNFIKFEKDVHGGQRRRDGDGEKESGHCKFFLFFLKKM